MKVAVHFKNGRKCPNAVLSLYLQPTKVGVSGKFKGDIFYYLFSKREDGSWKRYVHPIGSR